MLNIIIHSVLVLLQYPVHINTEAMLWPAQSHTLQNNKQDTGMKYISEVRGLLFKVRWDDVAPDFTVYKMYIQYTYINKL